MKYEPPDEAMDARQAEESKLARSEREQMRRERAAQTEKLRADRKAKREKA